MGVYHRRSQPPRQPSAAPRSAAPPVPCRAHPRFAWACCALPALPRNAKSPQPPKLPRSPVLRLEVRPCVSFLPRSLLSNDPTAMLRRDSPTAIRRARPTNPAPRSTTTFRGASRSLISAVVDDDVPWSVALGFCSAAFCRGAWVRVSSFDRAIYPGRRVLPRSTL